MLDRVLFLGQGGRTVYSGSVDDAETYFAKIGYPLPPYVNPADFYMDVIGDSVKNERKIYVSLFDEWVKHKKMVTEAELEGETRVEERPEVVDVQRVNQRTSNQSLSLGNEASSEDVLLNRGDTQNTLTVNEAHGIVNLDKGMFD